MLYDPKWEKTVKADPLTLEDLIAWLEKQSPYEAYDYTDPNACLAAQYLKAHGEQRYCLLHNELDEKLPGLGEIVYARENAGLGERTFGAALKRARAILASQSCRAAG